MTGAKKIIGRIEIEKKALLKEFRHKLPKDIRRHYHNAIAQEIIEEIFRHLVIEEKEEPDCTKFQTALTYFPEHKWKRVVAGLNNLNKAMEAKKEIIELQALLRDLSICLRG